MELVIQILKAVLPPLIDAVADMLKDKSEEEVKELRGQPLKVSIAFGGGEGESAKILAEIETKLPG